MRKIALFSLLMFVFAASIIAQDGFEFTDVVRHKTTTVKDQQSTGTCWSYSALSFMESEMIRAGVKDVPNLSPMYVARICYELKAEKAVRMQGHINYEQGGAFHDLLYVMKNYGLMPWDAYTGLQYGTDTHIHSELVEIYKNYIKAVIENKNKELTPSWKKGIVALLDSYLGVVPKSFQYNEKDYTPRTFADEVVKLNPNDYINISSYTHHPFYTQFAIEVPDNWMWGKVYNLPIDELMKVFDYALNNGYTVAWASDVSEKGFAYSKGIAMVPDADVENMTDSERAKWDNMNEYEKSKALYSLNKPCAEKKITQEMRQVAFDNYTTTDDHGMHIIGIAKDQFGKNYYIVKNSWGVSGNYDGYFYATEAFVKYKTMSIMVNKNSVPKDILKKLAEKNPELR